MGSKENGSWADAIGKACTILGVAVESSTKPATTIWERTRETRTRMFDDLVLMRIRKARRNYRMRSPRLA